MIHELTELEQFIKLVELSGLSWLQKFVRGLIN